MTMYCGRLLCVPALSKLGAGARPTSGQLFRLGALLTPLLVFSSSRFDLSSTRNPEPVFVNAHAAQESIPPGWESIPGLLEKFTNTGSAHHASTCAARNPQPVFANAYTAQESIPPAYVV